MPTITRQIKAPNDDAYKDQATSINLSGFVSFGNAGDVIRNIGLRFRSIPIPRSSTITSAYLKFKSNSNQSGTTCNARIYAENNSHPSEFSDYTDFAGRTLTSTYVDWSSIGSWTTGTEYTSPNIASVIQSIIDRGDWAENKDIVLFVNDNSSSTNARRAAYGFEDSTSDCPILEITYTAAPKFVIRASLPTYDALTDNDPDHFALYSDEDWILIKEFARGSVSFNGVSYPNGYEITHNLGYVPMFIVMVKDGSGSLFYPDTNIWCQVGNANLQVQYVAVSNTTKLKLYHFENTNREFKYYIFYDYQVGSSAKTITESDQVIKVSKAGINALTSTDPNDYIFHSDLNTFKIIKEGVQTISYTGNGIYEFNHNMPNANPATFMTMIKYPDGSITQGNGTFDSVSRDNNWYSKCGITSTKIKINLWNSVGSSASVYVKYYIFETPL